MIESARFTNINGSYIDFNDTELPFNNFTTEVIYRQSKKNRSQRHGIHVGYPYLGERIFHTVGDLLKNTSAEYWQKRLALINALMPRPHLNNGRVIGTLAITFTGMEPLTCECSLDGWPELPLEALSPSAGAFNINFMAANPRMFGAEQNTLAVVPPASVTGFSFPITFNLTFPGTSMQPADVLVTNAGNIEVYPRIYVIGPAESPAFTLVRYDGKMMTVRLTNLVLGAADYVDVDFELRTAVLNGTTNVYSTAVDSDWWALEPTVNGVVNTFRYTSGNPQPGSYARIYWRNAYMI